MSQEKELRNSVFSELEKDQLKCNYISNINFYKLPGSILEDSSRFNKFEKKFLAETDVCRPKSEEKLNEQVEVPLRLIRMDNPWGMYYIYPELYQNEVAPVVQVKTFDQLALTKDEEAGILSMRIIATKLKYIAKNPITGAFVLIKLELNALKLKNIDILGKYRFIQYLDISKNYLTSLEVLNHMPYLQYLMASYNQFSDLLNYDNAQWFLTEVHFKYNLVKIIRDLKPFWSLTVLDLSHNNIKAIKGLQELRYLRRLDLSFNHIQCLENLNNLRLTWLDVSYNRISGFEYTSDKGLWTLRHLEYLNINENMLKSLKILGRCQRIRELHMRNNGISYTLDMALYLHNLLKLHVLDMRENPICTSTYYRMIILTTFPKLLYLDGVKVDAVERATAKLETKADVMTYANRRLFRMMTLQQLSLPRIGPDIPAADTCDLPLIVLTGAPATAKGVLCRRLAKEYPEKVFYALLHTTAPCRPEDRENPLYHHITDDKFKEMLVAGNFLAYFEHLGDAYGLCRSEVARSQLAVPFSGKSRICVTRMSHVGALMLLARGLRPHVIRTMREDESLRTYLMKERTTSENYVDSGNDFVNITSDTSILRERLSARFFMGAILQDIIMKITEDSSPCEFIIDSEYSMTVCSDVCDKAKENREDYSLHSLYKQSETGTGSISDHISTSKRSSSKAGPRVSQPQSGQPSVDWSNKVECLETPRERKDHLKTTLSSHKDHVMLKNVDFGGKCKDTTVTNVSSTLFGTNTSKRSVTFQKSSLENMMSAPVGSDKSNYPVRGMAKSISRKIPVKHSSISSYDDLDYWIDFVTDVGIAQISDSNMDIGSPVLSFQYHQSSHYMQMDKMRKLQGDELSCWSKEFESNYPGIFSDTIIIDDIESAYRKLKKILTRVVNEQKLIQPLYDIEFREMNLPSINHRLAKIQKDIEPCGISPFWQ